MIFLRNDDQYESGLDVQGARACSYTTQGPLEPCSTADVLTAGAQVLETAVTHSKETTATGSNRYFFGTFDAAPLPTPQPRLPRA
jgi:hypothetical protein